MRTSLGITFVVLGLCVVYLIGFFDIVPWASNNTLLGMALMLSGELMALAGATVASRDDVWTWSYVTHAKREKEWTAGRVLYMICLIAFFPLMIEGLLNRNLYYSISFFLGVAYSARGVMFIPE